MYYENPDGVVIHDGFPNPATDSSLQGIDLNRVLIWHGASTYMMRVSGDDWQQVGIFENDIALVDRALNSKPTDLVVWLYDGSFTISNRSSAPKGSEIWGVVTTIIHQYRNKP